MDTNKKFSQKYFDKKQKKLERQLERERKTAANINGTGDARIAPAVDDVAVVVPKDQLAGVEPINSGIIAGTKFVGSTTVLGETVINSPVEQISASFTELSIASAKTLRKKGSEQISASFAEISRGSAETPGKICSDQMPPSFAEISKGSAKTPVKICSDRIPPTFAEISRGSAMTSGKKCSGQIPPSFAEVSRASARTPGKKRSTIIRGTVGQPGFVQANYVLLNMNGMPDIAYHYDVHIDPSHPKKFMRAVFEEFRVQCFKEYAMAFDGQHSFYTVKKLPDDNIEQMVEISTGGKRKLRFKIRLQLTANFEVSLHSLRTYHDERIFDKPMRALQCLEVVLAVPCHERSVRSGRAFYTQPDKLYDLGQSCEMWTGLYQAVILGDRPFVNIDIAHKPFSSQCHLIDFLHTTCKVSHHNRQLGRNEYQQFNEYVRGLCVTYVPPSIFQASTRNYYVNQVTEQSAENLFFQMTGHDEQRISVAKYFSSLGYRLQYPKLNCLHVGSKDKTIYLPIEFCSIARGQPLGSITATTHSQQMIRYSATSTTERKMKIILMLRYFNHNANETVGKFGLRVGTDFVSVPMRVLRSPQIEYFARETIIPGNGSWHAKDMTKFLLTDRPPSGHKWAIIYSTHGNANFNLLHHLGTMIVSASRRLNMALQDKPRLLQFDKIERVLGDLKRECYDLVVTVLPRHGVSYADVKKFAELHYGILTQCIKEETVERRLNPQLVYNLMLKVNAKLNGINHKIGGDSISLKHVMFLGADVSHPSPDQSEIPSVVGVVGSHDANGACYNMQYRLQQPTLECIDRMEWLFTHHVQIYFERQGRWPEHVIYYRDGVSDGQFPKIKDIEISGIRWACKKLGITIKLTCIIVVKRHHTRFFPQKETRGDRFNNVVPGTVVDRIIVHPNEMQFFMVSHQSVQGTVKPTRYNVIENDGNLDVNLLQTLTYNLCHMFPRCNRPVSCPTPAYLAHLVASRGRVYIDGTRLVPSESDRQYETRCVVPDFSKSNPMHFV